MKRKMLISSSALLLITAPMAGTAEDVSDFKTESKRAQELVDQATKDDYISEAEIASIRKQNNRMMRAAGGVSLKGIKGIVALLDLPPALQEPLLVRLRTSGLYVREIGKEQPAKTASETELAELAQINVTMEGRLKTCIREKLDKGGGRVELSVVQFCTLRRDSSVTFRATTYELSDYATPANAVEKLEGLIDSFIEDVRANNH